MNPLETIEQLLGTGTFFVPCEWGTKKPLVTYTERTFEGTKSDAYRAVLNLPQVNLAVYLGQASGGLCAIDFDADEDLATFLGVNPKLATTTRSRGSRGGMVWLRIQGEHPESCNPAHKHFEWRADKRLSTIYGRHPKGMDYTLTVNAPPVTISFSEIVWPDGWHLPWVGAAARAAREALAKEFGQPFYLNKDGKVTGINERFWAGLYARENRALYDPDEKTFYRYESETGLWLTITPESIREVISARILEVSREAGQFSLELQITLTKLKAIVGVLMGIVEKRDVFQTKQRFIHVANGVIRFTDDSDVTFGGFSPDDYSRNKSPYAFDAAAECPRFLNELIYPAVSAEDADLLQRWAGLALFGYNLPQRLLILDGTANGGKGTLVRIIQSLVGLTNTYQLRTECLLERFETFRFRAKTMLIGPDVPGDFLMQKGASILKSLVGGDPLSGEGKGLNGDFPMFGNFNVVMTCNSRLRVRLDGDTSAWRRRLLIIRYQNPPPANRILDFHVQLLRDEGSGILRWALAGFVKLQSEFAERGDFALTETQRGRVDSLLAESDSLRIFVNQRLEKHEYGDVTTAEISQAYAEFCADNAWNVLPTAVVERTLPDLILDAFHVPKSHSIERDSKRSNRGWHMIRLRDAAEPAFKLQLAA
jgi:putative DNA primase/helicase